MDSLFQSFSTNWIDEVLRQERDCLVAAALTKHAAINHHRKRLRQDFPQVEREKPANVYIYCIKTIRFKGTNFTMNELLYLKLKSFIVFTETGYAHKL